MDRVESVWKKNSVYANCNQMYTILNMDISPATRELVDLSAL